MIKILCVQLLLHLHFQQGCGYNYPSDQYVHSTSRDSIKETEQQWLINLPLLSQDEKIVDSYLQYLKLKEFEASRPTGFRPSRPIEEQMSAIVESDMYRVLRPLPKGGILHVHEDQDLNRRTLLEIVWTSDQFQYLWVQPDSPESTRPWNLDFFINPPEDENWIRVTDSGLTMEDILQKQTLIDILDDYAKKYPTDTDERWRQMNLLWTRAGNLMNNVEIYQKHLEAIYNQSMSEGVQYIESRLSFFGLYRLDPTGENSATNGRIYLDVGTGTTTVDLTLETIQQFKTKNPSFIDHRRIFQSNRRSSFDTIRQNMNLAKSLYETYPDHMVGYDLVSAEDGGNSLLYYINEFLQLYDPNTKQSVIPLYLHTSETNWPDDLITSVNPADPLTTLENSYESLILLAKRVGHGLGYIKKPYLLEEFRNRGIAVEICPVSNQLLGNFPDLRSHPAQNYYRSGVPIVLGPDDPGSFGYLSFTIDWYAAYMAWGLNLADLKQLANNSLQYSSMTPAQRQDAINNYWLPAWNKYIDDMKQEACSASINDSASFSMVFPDVGYSNGTTVHIYGRNFQRAICKTIICTFGNIPSTKVSLVSNSHIICEAPLYPEVPDEFLRNKKIALNKFQASTVPVSVDLGDGVQNVVGNFTYIN